MTNKLPVVFISQEDKDKSRMKAISITLGILGGGVFAALAIFEPGPIIWAIQTGGIALAIAVMILSIAVPIAYKYDQRHAPPPEENYIGVEVELSKITTQDKELSKAIERFSRQYGHLPGKVFDEFAQYIIHSNRPENVKTYWLNLAGIGWVMVDGKVQLSDASQAEQKYNNTDVPMRDGVPEAGTGDEPNIDYHQKKAEREKPKPLKSLKDHKIEPSLKAEGAELEINKTMQ